MGEHEVVSYRKELSKISSMLGGCDKVLGCPRPVFLVTYCNPTHPAKNRQ